MNAIRIELLIVNTDDVSVDEVVDIIENTKYPNHCIAPRVMACDVREIGKFSDEHPLNKYETMRDEFNKLFNP